MDFGGLLDNQAKRFLRAFKPNLAVLGYALFLAINAAGVWGGVFPFLPMGFQTTEITFWFFMAESLVFTVSFLASALGVYYLPGPTRRFLVGLASVPYLLGWVCLIAAIYIHKAAVPFVIAGGALLGLGAAGFCMLWQRLFASFDADQGNHDLILGTAYGSILYFALYAIPQAVTVFLIPLIFLPLFGLAISLKSREIDLDQPMFEDIPREHPRVYRNVLHLYWRSAFCVGAIAFCAGIMRSVAIREPEIGVLVNVLSMIGALLTAVIVLVVWQLKNLRLSVTGAYRIFFPFVITSFVILPFLGLAFERWQAAILYAVYSAAIMLMMVQCAQVSRDRGINPIFIYGFFGAVMYILHDLGFIAGTFAERIRVIGLEPNTIIALVAIYLLGLMFFIGQGGFGHILRPRQDESIELMFEANPFFASDGDDERGERGAGVGDTEIGTTGESEGDRAVVEEASASGTTRGGADETDEIVRFEVDAIYLDRLSKQAEVVRHRYRLSAREAEVMEMIARGYTVPRIAEELIVSENTIRTHSKRIYAKLGIHSKYELRDLVESFNPRDLEDL